MHIENLDDGVNRDQWFKIILLNRLQKVSMVNCTFHDAIIINMVNDNNLKTFCRTLLKSSACSTTVLSTK